MGGLKSPSYDGMPKGESDPDGVHRKAMLAVRLEEAIRAARLREESERDDLERMVSRMPRAMERMVLRLRYFDRMPWDDVAFAMYGDRADFLDCEPEYRRKVYRRHTEAVLSLALVDAKEAIVRRSA